MAKKIVARNRKALHDYLILDRFEAGMALRGSEIKSIRNGQISIKEAYVQVIEGEVFLINAHIATYNPASTRNHEPTRQRKLLLHRREIEKINDSIRQKGLTVVPLQVYLVGGLAKIEIAISRGKRRYDKRRAIAKRDAEREMAREMSRVRKGGS